MSKNKLLVIAAGGTGGHMFPAQSLAEEMLHHGWRVKLVTDPRGARYTQAFPDAVKIEVVNSGSFARGGFLAKAKVPFDILRGTFAALFSTFRDPPAVVAGFGGYPTIPSMIAAILTRCPRLIHEQNGVLGRVNKIFAKRVNTLACGTWPTELPEGVSHIHTGNPVRSSVLKRAGAEYITPGDWPMSILVIGGSQGAHILSQTVPKAIQLLPDDVKPRLRIAQQARQEDIAETQLAYASAGVQAEIEPFFQDVPRRMAEAQLVISRAGASSVADISVIGRPSILVPLALAMDDHQTANAKGLETALAAIILPESAFSPKNLAEAIIAVIADPDRAKAMAQSALEQGKPDAVKILANTVEALADGDKIT